MGVATSAGEASDIGSGCCVPGGGADAPCLAAGRLCCDARLEAAQSSAGHPRFALELCR